jgi:alkylhydroperoxidase/carboxymuconolactone decarboxylase family protein YurZ
MTASDDGETDLRAEFIRRRGYWARAWDVLLAKSPKFFSAYLDMSSVPYESSVLDKKTKELIFIALDSNAAHLYEPGLRIHIRNAMRLGASEEEILEVLQLASAIGIHSVSFGLPILMDELTRRHKQSNAAKSAGQDPSPT